MLFWFLFCICWLPLRILYPTKVIGKKNMLKKQGFVFACNHYSNMDPIVINIQLNKKMRFLAKKELFKNKFMNFILRKIGAFPIDREKPEVSSFKFALNSLKANKILAIFPEGTRNKTGNEDLQEIKSGAVLFAGKGEAPIVPAMFYKKSKILRRNYLLIGEPITLDAENCKKMTQEELEKNTQKLVDAMNKLREDFDAQLKAKKEKKNARK